MSDNKEYILGINDTELERLKFQHGVWKEMTDGFLEKINIQKGWKCLDVGAGPGFVSLQLLESVSETGEVTVLEPGQMFIDSFKKECTSRKISNVKFIQNNIENAKLEENNYDLIYIRWVIDFVPDAENLLLKLIHSLKKGGVIAIQDYAYEGIALFPKGGAFDNIAEYVRNYYIAGGGDPYFTVRIPKIFRDNNLTMKEYAPVIQAGGYKSDVFKWAFLFFKGHLKTLTELKIISPKLEEELWNDLKSHADNPDMIFFTPVIVNIIGKKN